MPDKLAVRACVFDAYGTLFDLASAAARCNDVLGDKTAAVAAALAREADHLHLAAGRAEPARRLLAGDRRRARLHAGDARHHRPRRPRAPDGPLPQARSLPRGAGHAAPPEGRRLRHRHPVERHARHAARPGRQLRPRPAARSRAVGGGGRRVQAAPERLPAGRRPPGRAGHARSASSPPTPGTRTPRPRSACASSGATATASAASACPAPPTARSARWPNCHRCGA